MMHMQFFTQCVVLFVSKWRMENVTWGTAVLYPAGCVSDILNKVGLCGKSIKRIMSHFLQAGVGGGGGSEESLFCFLDF